MRFYEPRAQRTHFLELGVIRTFEFVSALRRMSVIVKRLKSTSMEIYVKGAPEVMNEICVRDPCEFFRLFRGWVTTDVTVTVDSSARL